MELIINGSAIARSSLGARRYYEAVRARLDIPGTIEVTAARTGGHAARLRDMLDRGRPGAVYWSPCHSGPVLAKNHVITVLDCINIEYTYANDWRLPFLRRYLQMIFANAVAIVGISQATKDAVLRNFNVRPEKIVVIAGPTDIGGQPIIEAEEADGARGEASPFVLMIANDLPHKNTAFAGRAFAASEAAKRGTALRIIGSMADDGRLACEAAGVDVSQYKNIDDKTLGRWMSRAVFLLSPSLDEGLNLPIAEAICAGTRVVCSDIPVHREFYDGSVDFFDPRSLDSAAQSINAAFNNMSVSRKMELKEAFSIESVAAQYSALFQEVSSNVRLKEV